MKPSAPPFEVTLCLATTLDGKIAAKPGQAPDFTSRTDLEKLFKLRAGADVLLVGANTVRQEELPPLVRNPDLAEARARAGRAPHPAVAIVTGSLNLPWESSYFTQRQQEIFIITGRSRPDLRGKIQAAGLQLLETGEPFSLRQGLTQLADRGYPQILGEGGGYLTHSLLNESLVQRLFLTVAPFMFGGMDTPVLCKGPLLAPRAAFRLEACRQIGNELHLEYRTVEEGSP